MIKIRRVTDEGRQRDRRRQRLILTIGDNQIHLTREEGKNLKCDLAKFKF